MSQQKSDLAQSWETREDSKTRTWDQRCSGTKVNKLYLGSSSEHEVVGFDITDMLL